jgi:hypothetical protein
MTPAEPEKANLIALAHARNRATSRDTIPIPEPPVLHPARATQQHPDRRSIAPVTALATRWPRRRTCAANSQSVLPGDASGVNDARAEYVL